jgi:hypothetical protein
MQKKCEKIILSQTIIIRYQQLKKYIFILMQCTCIHLVRNFCMSSIEKLNNDEANHMNFDCRVIRLRI